MKLKRRAVENTGDSLLDIILYRYLPYWPLFVALSVLLLAVAFVATRYITPTYRVTATLVINDKEKGTRESETLRSLNVYAGDKIVENEILVLTSRSLVRDVVLGLKLYAPVFEEGEVKSSSAYLTSPIVVEVRDPAKLKEQESVAFSFDAAAGLVRMGNKQYPLNRWINFPFATLRFLKNPHYKRETDRELYFSLIDPKKATVGILERLEIGPSSKLSSVINVVYTDEVPERGEDIVNELLNAYLRASVEYNNQLALNTLSFISERLDSVESELDSINRRVQEFRTAEGAVDLSEQGRLYLQQVAENDRQLSEINMQLAVLDQVEQYVRSGATETGIIPTTLGIQDPVLADLIQTLNELELQYASLRATTGANNPLAESVESEIQKIRPNILDIVRNQRSWLQASRGNLAGTTGRFNSMIGNIPRKERELLEISRQQAIKNDAYAFLLQRKEEAELSAASTIPDSRIVDWAEASFSPVSSKRLLFLVGALMASFALAIAYIFLREGLNSSILFRSKIERSTVIPVAMEIPHVRALRSGNNHLLRDDFVSSTFQQLQAALGLFTREAEKRSIIITSNFENEGKTFVSNQLAVSLAQAGQKVLLADLNLHASETTSLHQLQYQDGFSDFVEGNIPPDNIIHRSETENLFILPAGKAVQNPTALLLHDSTQYLLEQVSKDFDFLVIDSAPLELATDAYLLAKHCDVSILVIRQGVTPASVLQKLDDSPKLQAMPEPHIVFNDVKPRGFFTNFYGYGYGYGYEKMVKSKSYRKRT